MKGLNKSLQRTAGLRFSRFVAQWPAAAEFNRSMKAPLKAIAVTMLMLGCRSVPTQERLMTYPLPPAPLSQFVKNPVDGIYSLLKPVASGYGPDLKVVIVSGERIRFSCADDRGIGTNDWNFVEFKATLPPEDVFQQIAAGTTEEQIERRFGRPTWEQNRNATYNWEKMPSDTRVVHYQWCTVSPTSELVFMRLTAIYTRKDGVWAVRDFEWAKWQDRKLSSNRKRNVENAGAR